MNHHELIDAFVRLDRGLSALFNVRPAHVADVAAFVSALEAMDEDQLGDELRKLDDLREALDRMGVPTC